MKPKPTKKPRKPAIVVGMNMHEGLVASIGLVGEIREHGFFYGKGSSQSETITLCTEYADRLGLTDLDLRPGQYIRFVQDGGVRKARKARRVKS